MDKLLDPDSIRLISWGQYIHWADLQFERFHEQTEENSDNSAYIGLHSHWLAALYVVVEGWEGLKESDPLIDELLAEYSDYISYLRQCRNAVYHFQKRPLDKRIIKTLNEKEFYTWSVSIKCEFERFLFMQPFRKYGMCKESAELHEAFFGCIGWKPENNIWVKWIDLYTMCIFYQNKTEMNKLEITKENDERIEKCFKQVLENKPITILKGLTRLKNIA